MHSDYQLHKVLNINKNLWQYLRQEKLSRIKVGVGNQILLYVASITSTQ